MKCPRCGSEMTLDTHRKYPLEMCYNCGYMEGRNMGTDPDVTSNFAYMKALNFNETVSFLSKSLGLDPVKLADWLDNPCEK
ncbi:MAG: zf-TFIIB domain-containing protein [Oscillospiraceae bacterium]|nr:zf-TFIIB domain-containing protein [Oscillospiraceae bacterium]